MIDREFISRLQQAHGDCIEAGYRQALALPGNPRGIEILNIGATRLFLSSEANFGNRALFSGNETQAELEAVTACFERKGITGYFEINQTNFYRSNPFSWQAELVPALLKLGYQI
ncbi:MAG: hypothetical protein KDE59_18435, partial [Anaerolineales bacterium]|nr:hypothetical protein [Anaerolineales bacterium]